MKHLATLLSAVLLLSACSAPSEDQAVSRAPAETRPAADVVPGHCFDAPRTEESLDTVVILDCYDLHAFEALWAADAPFLGPRPQSSDLVDWARQECLDAFPLLGEYGIESNALLFLLPNAGDWHTLDDREVVCIAPVEGIRGSLALDTVWRIPSGSPVPRAAAPVSETTVVETTTTTVPPPTSTTTTTTTTTTTPPETTTTTVPPATTFPSTTVPPEATTTTTTSWDSVVVLNLGYNRICLHYNPGFFGSTSPKSCDSMVIAEASTDECPRGVKETWNWDFDSYLCEASIYMLAWEKEVAKQLTGKTLTVDGIVTPSDEPAIRAFQRSMGLYDDGYIGPQTWRAVSAFDCQLTPSSPYCSVVDKEFWLPGDPFPYEVLR